MTHTTEMRALSAEEIDFVAGGGYPSHKEPSSGTTNTVLVNQQNFGGAVALGLIAGAANIQTNVAVISNGSSFSSGR